MPCRFCTGHESYFKLILVLGVNTFMRAFHLKDIVNILSRTPHVLEIMLRDLPDHLTHRNEGPGTWSPFDVIGHFIHGEKTDWIPRMMIVLSDTPDRVFEPFDREAMFKASAGKKMNTLLNEFRELREKNLQILTGLDLTPDHLNRTGIHPDFGTVTLQQLLSTWAVHDLNHLIQIERVIAKQYEEEVGPWKKYLRVLQ